MLDAPRKFKPLWRWELLLFALVLLLAIAANVVIRAAWPVVSAVLTVLLLVVAVGLAALLIVPLFRARGRDSENTLRTVEGAELVAAQPVGEQRMRVPLEGGERRQTAIEAARATSRGTPTAVLTPDASRWLGRELRVAVDLVADDGRVYRAGFVPRDLGAALDPQLHELRSSGRIATVPIAFESAAGGRVAVTAQL
jgi:membrane protein implicated in regulation of membrane protease activity